jgi:hypothetical protein
MDGTRTGIPTLRLPDGPKIGPEAQRVQDHLMSRNTSIRGIARPTIFLGVALVAVYAMSASGVLGGGPQPSDPPKPTATPAPTAAPTPTPTPVPTQPPAGGPLTVNLDIATDHDVSVVVTDKSGTLKKVVTGRAGDGMSVRWGDWKAENLDASTIRLTWVGLPGDEALALTITETGGTYALAFVQAAPPPLSDAVGFDRVLVLTFDAEVSADDLKVTFEVPAA